jgi:uncharacterized protein (TIGR03435 family)
MLRALLSERFKLKHHREIREMRMYELLADRGDIKIRLTKSGKPANAGAGLHFHGDMRQFADFLAVQFSVSILDDQSQPGRAGGPAIPVLDRTGLSDIFDFVVDVRPELGPDSFTLWQRAPREQLGLRIESRRGPVEVLVVDDADKVPNSN